MNKKILIVNTGGDGYELFEVLKDLEENHFILNSFSGRLLLPWLLL